MTQYNEVKKYIFQTIGKKVRKISIKNFWIVRQFNNEYNPIHWHGGHVSGVAYLKLPEKVINKEALNKYKNVMNQILYLSLFFL